MGSLLFVCYFLAEDFLTRLEIGFETLFGAANVAIEGNNDGTKETVSVSDTIEGRQVVCYSRGHLLCYYRESIVNNGRRMCSSIIHEIKSTSSCFDFEVCDFGVCLEIVEEGNKQSFWNREQPAAIGLIVLAVIIVILINIIICQSFSSRSRRGL